MTQLKKFKSLLGRYKEEEEGSLAVAYSISFMALLIAIGAGYDFALLSNADHKSQNIADTAALSAAVFYSQNQRVPLNHSEGYVDGHNYTTEYNGFRFGGEVATRGRGRPRVRVEYDLDAGVARATVTGEMTPVFVKMFGRDTLPFKEVSEASFREIGFSTPASVFIAVDGSGSMGWDDKRDTDPSDDRDSYNSTTPGAQARVEGLKESLEVFMEKLDATPGETEDVVRSGMYVYTSNYERGRSQEIGWGVLPYGRNSKIDRLFASGGTNASQAMEEIRKDLPGEGAAHYAKHGNNQPLKFVILMTDGVNSPTGRNNYRWERMPAHKHWEGRWWDSRTRRMISETSHAQDMPRYGGGWQQKNIAANQEWKQYFDEYSSHDNKTRDECDAIAAQGATIYTIAYGLEVGRYHKRDRYYEPYREQSGFIYDGYHINLPETTRDRAYGVMQYCATVGGGKFIPAEDADKLTEAFDSIGEEIIQEVIRIRT